MTKVESKEDAISVVSDFISRFGYIELQKIEKVEYVKEKNQWMMLVRVKQAVANEFHIFEVRISGETGQMEKFEMMGYTP